MFWVSEPHDVLPENHLWYESEIQDLRLCLQGMCQNSIIISGTSSCNAFTSPHALPSTSAHHSHFTCILCLLFCIQSIYAPRLALPNSGIVTTRRVTPTQYLCCWDETSTESCAKIEIFIASSGSSLPSRINYRNSLQLPSTVPPNLNQIYVFHEACSRSERSLQFKDWSVKRLSWNYETFAPSFDSCSYSWLLDYACPAPLFVPWSHLFALWPFLGAAVRHLHTWLTAKVPPGPLMA